MKTLKQNLSTKLKKKAGFTLIEMLIVVAIIAILIAISIPLVGGALDKAKKATDAANVRAACAEAVIEYLTEEGKEIEASQYDASNGKIVGASETGVKAYGKVKDNTSNIVWVKVSSDGQVEWVWSAPGTAPGSTVTWEKGTPVGVD